jgi:MoaA/NifB/PqqE/SkfB family radical SAM enzyme
MKPGSIAAAGMGQRLIRLARAFALRRHTLEFDKVLFPMGRVSGRRHANWLRNEWAAALRLDVVPGLPTHLQVEPGNVCNLRCPLCHVVTDGKPQGFMETDRFRGLMREVGDTLMFLHFWGWGEPFLHPDLAHMIRLAKDRGAAVITSTNGHFFDGGHDPDALIDSGLDALIFALDGADPETYDRYRRRGDFHRVVGNLRRLALRKRERRSAAPLINLRMLVHKGNEHQVAAVHALAKDLGADQFTLKTLCHFDNEAEGRNILPDNPAYRRFRYDGTGNPVRIRNRCKKPWNHPTVYRDGTVVPCDYHTGLEMPMGNAFGAGGFSGVWHGPAFRAFRSRFRRNRLDGLRCEGCSLNFAPITRCVSHSYPVAR